MERKIKKNTFIFFILLLVAFFIILTNCNQPISGSKSNDNKGNGNDSTIPYANDSELAALPVNRDYPSWQIIRTLAVMEFENGSVKQKVNCHCDSRLSEKPVIIYDCMSMPYRYEFFILDSTGKAFATIATTTRRGKTAGVITEVFPYVRDYSIVLTSDDMHLFAVNYPNELFQAKLKSSGSRAIEADTVNADDPHALLKQLSVLSDDDLKNMGLPGREEMKAQINADIAEYEKNCNEFWNSVESNKAAIENLDDMEIAFKTETIQRATTYYTDQYIISTYNYNKTNDATRTIWFGWCGPSALCNAYMSISHSYNGKSLLNQRFNLSYNGQQMGGDRAWVSNNISPYDGGLYYDLADKTGGFLTGSWVLATSFSGAMRYVTSNTYAVYMPPILYSASDALRCMKSDNLPFIWWVTVDHYCTIIGASIDKVKYDWLFFPIITNSYVLIYDNGALSSANGYRPFWKSMPVASYIYQVVKL